MRKILLRTVSEGHAESMKGFLLVAVFLLFISPCFSIAGELTGKADMELWHFPTEPLYNKQERSNVSLSFESEYFHPFDDTSSITLVPFFRNDKVDSERTHFDLREMNYHLVLENIEFRIGVGKVFWGATEFVHLVDVINQTDLVENPDGEDKLGQPMVQLVKSFESGTIEFFILPYFRERTFPGKSGRFRTSIPVDTDNPSYEHPEEERHIDIASRLSGMIGMMDVGFSYFKGTGREPTLLTSIDGSGSIGLVPYYEQIEQLGIDIQAVSGPLLSKVEAFNRSVRDEKYFAVTGGLEYTFTDILHSGYDLGTIAEYAYESRDENSTSVFQNDVMLGLRLVLNDLSGTELLLGYLHDVEYDSKTIRLEGSRRLGDNMRISLDAGAFFEIDSQDNLYYFINDDYIMFKFSYYL